MIRVKMFPKNELCIIDNAKVYRFNSAGACVEEAVGLLPKYTTGMVELPIISVLASNNTVELACFCENGVEMKRYSVPCDAMECALKVQSCGGFIRMLNRSGRHNDTSFNQLIFVYKEGTCFDNIIKVLDAKEIN